jgi:formyltetrahydrofolate-dependent phosphoribosylglycinamide formyltransferase
MSNPLPIAVLISGGGTTLQNFIDLIEDGELPARIVQVISSRSDAFGVERAQKAGLPVAVVNRKEAASAEIFSQRIFELCRASQAELVCMAGFLHLLPVPDDFALRVMNIHPALLPSFGGHGMYGQRVHESVLAFGAKVSGCTVHFADNEYDHGPIIIQRTIPVLDEDTPETLAFRVFEQECIAYPEAIRLFSAAKLKVDGRRIRMIDGKIQDQGDLNWKEK